jgi:hypothetical protein
VPEWYVNNVTIREKSHPVAHVDYGEIHLFSAQLGSEGIECVALSFGSVWNERAGGGWLPIGQILVWSAAGHVPEAPNEELSASCRPQGKIGSFITDEADISSEINASNEVAPALRTQSTPWNLERRCGIREAGTEYVGIVTIGVPSTEFPKAGELCPGIEPTEAGEAMEIAEHKKEREEKKGCYASIPAPPGCVRMTVVEPATGLEVAYGGSLYLHLQNGVKNGLSASRWKLEGATSNELQCEFPAGCNALATLVGVLKMVGYSSQQLLTVK